MVSASDQAQWGPLSFSLLDFLFTTNDDSGHLGHDALTESTVGFIGWPTHSSLRVCSCYGLYCFRQHEIQITEPFGGANGDEPFRSRSISTSAAAHPRRSPLTFARKLRLVRPLKVKGSYSVGFSPDGRKCFTLARDVSLWDLDSRKKSWRSHPVSHPSDAAFSAKGDLIAIKSTSGRIVTLASGTGQVRQDFENDPEGEGSNLLFSGCGRFIVDGSWRGFLTLRDAFSGLVRYRREHKGEMLCRVHSVCGGTAWIVEHSPKATTHDRSPADSYFTVSTWPLPDGAPAALGIRLPFICASAVSEDGSRLAVLFGAPPRDLRVYELPSERSLWQARVTIGGSGSELRWSRCGRFLASVQKDCIAHYCGATGQRLTEFPLPFPSDIDYSPDTRLIALGSWQSGEIRPLASQERGNGEPHDAANGSQPFPSETNRTSSAASSRR